MKRPSKNKDRIFVSESSEIISKELVDALAIPKEQADEVARQATNGICHRFARQAIYIPTDIQFDLTKRDLDLYNAWNGQNMDDLIIQFKLSAVQIYKILKQVRQAQRAKNEPQLPGFEYP
jgi:Mor family transcriptional regulator